MRVVVLALLASAFVLLGCSVSEESPETSTPERVSSEVKQESAEVEERATKSSSSIPEGISYSILETDIIPGVKRSLTVRLNKKVSEEVLHAVAMELKRSDSRRYDRTFIVYYLPGMEVGAGAWATTHFNPTLDVQILGLTSEDETALSKAPAAGGREVLGEWIDDRPYVASRISLFREKGALHISFAFKDGSVWDNEVRESSSSLGRRFDPVKRSATGDHWVIDSNGNLRERDAEGLIATARKVK